MDLKDGFNRIIYFYWEL